MSPAQRPPVRDDNALVTIDGPEPFFPAHVDPEDRWNGWLCPSFRREVADEVLAWVNKNADEYPDCSERGTWRGDSIVLTHPEAESEEVISPDQYGRYPIGSYAWCWSSPGPEHITVKLGPRASWPALVPWQVHALGEWLAQYRAAMPPGGEEDVSTHEPSHVGEYAEDETAGAVRLGWHWWWVIVDREGTVRAAHARRATRQEVSSDE